MNTQNLRRAIAAAFPTSYHFWTWRKLLPEFVDTHLKAITIRWVRHQHESDPAATAPTLAPVVEDAVGLLARQCRLSYDRLALSHFVQLHQNGALRAENQQLRADLARAMQLLESYNNHSERAIDYLEQVTNPDPNNRPN